MEGINHHMSRAEQSAIVFGGAGFIGTHLLIYLASTERYGRLISFDLEDPNRPVPGVEYIKGDVRIPIVLDPAITSPEIYNLAAVHKTPGHRDWEYFWTNVLGAINVCNYASAVGCEHLLFTSSISVYGPTESPVDENTVLRPNSAYGRSKLAAEGIHHTWFENGPKRRLVVVRPAVVFGVGERGNFTRLAYLLARHLFVYPGRRDTIKACIYVDELIRTMEFARSLNRREFTYNGSYPARTTIEDICRAFSETAGFALPKLTIPLPVMLAGASIFKVLDALGVDTAVSSARLCKLVFSTNVLPRALQDSGYIFETDLPKALHSWKQETVGSFV